jgi:tetratricopeptide (TPR) repeat protein
MKELTCILILLCCISNVPVYATEGDNAALLARVEAHIEHGEPKKALKLLSTRLDATPGDLELLSKRAEVYLMLSKKKEASKELRAILFKDENYGPALLNYAVYQNQIQNSDSSLWYIEKALAQENNSPTEEELYSLKGNILLEMGEYQEAEDNLFMAANRSEVSITTMRDLGAILSKNKKYHESLAVLRETMLIFGERLEFLINAGFICNRLGMFDEAKDYLTMALLQDPDQPLAHSNIAEAYLYLGSVQLAYDHIIISTENDNLNAFAYKIKGDCLTRMQEPEKACKSYKEAYTLDYDSSMFGDAPLIKVINEICGNDGIISEQ